MPVVSSIRDIKVLNPEVINFIHNFKIWIKSPLYLLNLIEGKFKIFNGLGYNINYTKNCYVLSVTKQISGLGS